MKEEFIHNILEAHGGLERWKSYTKVNVTIVSGGKLFDLIGQPQDGAPRSMEIYLKEQRLALTPYGGPDKKTNFQTNRIAIETLDGKVLSQRTGSIEELHGHMKDNGWDALDRAYFNGYANWTYLVTPFFLALPDVKAEEIASYRHEGETWKGLRVTFPDTMATHCPVQDFYFGPDYLLRRHDYIIDVAGEFDATQYVADYIEVDGIRLPSKRRAYKKLSNGLPSIDELMVHLNYTDIHFT